MIPHIASLRDAGGGLCNAKVEAICAARNWEGQIYLGGRIGQR